MSGTAMFIAYQHKHTSSVRMFLRKGRCLQMSVIHHLWRSCWLTVSVTLSLPDGLECLVSVPQVNSFQPSRKLCLKTGRTCEMFA